MIELQTGRERKRRITIVIQRNSDFLHFINSIRMSNKFIASTANLQSQGDLKLYSNEELRKMRKAIHKRLLDPASEIL
jgi:hypothetical protein